MTFITEFTIFIWFIALLFLHEMYDINAFGTLKNVLSISSFICAPARPGFPKIHLRTQYSLEKGLTPRVKTHGFEVDTATPAYGGIHPNWMRHRGSGPGAFNLDHLHPVKPILFSKIYNFFTFILEAISYYPSGLIMRKGNSPNSING